MVAFFYPFAWLPFNLAWAVWAGLGMLITAAVLKLHDYGQSRRWIIVLTAVAASLPAYFNFRVGQNAVFLLAGSALFFYFFRQNQAFKAGLSSVVLLCKPQFAPLFVVAGLILGKFEYLGGLAIAWVGAMVGMGLAALAVGLLWGTYRTSQRSDNGLFELLAACTLLLALIFGIHVLPYEYMSLSVVAMLLWRALSRVSSGRRSKVLRVLILVTPFLSWGTFAFVPLLAFLMPLGSLALIAASPLLMALVHPLLVVAVAQLILAAFIARGILLAERAKEAMPS
jgi:hypothetical protein